MKRASIWVLSGVLVLFAGFQIVRADMCPLAKEMAAKSLKVFDSDQKKGLSGLIQALKYCPDDKEIAYNLGLAYYRYKRPDMAYKIWSDLAAKNSGDAKLLTNLAWLALESGKGEEASSWAEKAGKAKPGDANVMAVTVEIMFSRGKYSEALAYAWENRSGLPAETVQKASEYATETQWNVFRDGQQGTGRPGDAQAEPAVSRQPISRGSKRQDGGGPPE